MGMTFITGTKGLIGGELLRYFDKNAIGFDKGDTFPTDNSKNIEMIIHCASNCVVRKVINNPELMMENINITYKIMEFARINNIKKVVLFSSSRVNHKEKNPYTVSKQFLENIAEGYKQCYGVECIIIQPETVWGYREKNRRVICTWIDNILSGKEIIIYGDKDKELPPIHVKEFVELFLLLVQNFDQNKGKTISIAGKTKKVTEIISDIEKVTGKKAKIVFKPAETAQPQKCTPSTITGKQEFVEQLKRELK